MLRCWMHQTLSSTVKVFRTSLDDKRVALICRKDYAQSSVLRQQSIRSTGEFSRRQRIIMSSFPSSVVDRFQAVLKVRRIADDEAEADVLRAL